MPKSKLIKILVLTSGILTASLGYSIYLTQYSGMKPEVKYLFSSRFGKFITDKCDILNESFTPAFWARSPLMQTVISSMLRSRITTLNYSREILTCPDGGIVSLDWFEGASGTEERAGIPPEPIALMFPGLVGDSQSDYLRYIVPVLKKQGYRVVSFNNRGRGGLELRTPRLYCASNIEDYEHAVSHLRRRNPTTRIVAAGFSMGAMLLTRYLTVKGDKSQIDAAILISGNYDLVNGTKNMETGWMNRLIAKIMTKALVRVILNDKDMLAKSNKKIEWDKLEAATSFRELDKYFTCPLWDYPDPDAYFRDSTNNDRMPQIKVPTLCLNAADDFFSPYETLPLDRLSESTVFVVTKRGGHLGFADGYPSLPYYGDRLIAQFFNLIKDVESLKDLARPLEENEN